MADITKSIWAGLISNWSSVEGNATLRRQTDTTLGGGPGRVSSRDISRAANPYQGSSRDLSRVVPQDNARLFFGDDVDGSDLINVLDTFMKKYSRIRTFQYRRRWTSYQNGNPRAQSPAGSIPLVTIKDEHLTMI